MKIEVNCEGSFLMEWKNLVDIQEGAKEINGPEMEKLLNSLSENGFCDPFCVWHNTENGQDVCIAGNQRLKALYRAKELGWEVPDKLPANKVNAKNLKDATKILLSLASTFGRVNKIEIEKMATDVGLDMQELEKITSFIEIDIEEMQKQALDATRVTDDLAGGLEKSEYIEFIKIPYPKDEFNEIYTSFDLYKSEGGFENLSEAFRGLLKDGMERLKSES